MHAEAVEAKERLQIELDAAYEYNKKVTVKSRKADSNNNSFEKISMNQNKDGLLAKATNLFSSASSFYTGRS